MITIRNYKKVESLEEAWELNQKKTNRIIGGMLWTKMSKENVQTAIDLSGLGLDTIEENEEEFRIGCMVTLRQLEEHAGLVSYTCGAMKEAVRHIVGVQFRNLATIGGSIWGRYGFSDVLTMFMAMDSYVELYKGGIVPMHEFAERKADRDILVRILVKKTPGKFDYQSVRNTSTDFPVLTCAASCVNGEYRLVVGGRPNRAVRLLDEEQILAQGTLEEQAARFGVYAADKIQTGSNMRGTSEYRTHLVEVLASRGIQKLGGM